MPAPETDHELLTEHFTYPPVALLDDIINTVNILADRALDSVERLLLSIPPQKLGFPSASAARTEIESGTHQLETLLNASIDKNFDLFELYTVRNILTVSAKDAPFVRLSHYEGLDFDSCQEGDIPSLESVTSLRRRLHASQRLNAALEKERLRNDDLLRRMHALLGEKKPSSEDADDIASEEEEEEGEIKAEEAIFAHLLKTPTPLTDAGSDHPITTTTEFALSQLPALRSLSSTLQSLIPNLRAEDEDGKEEDGKEAANSAAQGDSSWRSQRTEYVEASSRKCVERVGHHRDNDDEGSDWHAQAGPRLAAGDVETLEGIAAALAQGEANREQDEAKDAAEAMDTS
ncbi:hypothetical protein CP533_0932 [Ophiocordyceps camponoti-saundersi (nom. inval.)]|nr:hypothetical protein CP533_0932 [Ophiocordyceps camponoti-saundersi (nom. inval.)]